MVNESAGSEGGVRRQHRPVRLMSLSGRPGPLFSPRAAETNERERLTKSGTPRPAAETTVLALATTPRRDPTGGQPRHLARWGPLWQVSVGFCGAGCRGGVGYARFFGRCDTAPSAHGTSRCRGHRSRRRGSLATVLLVFWVY